MIPLKRESISLIHILEKKGLLDAKQVKTLFGVKSDDSIVRCLIEITNIPEDQIIEIINEYYDISYVDLDDIVIDIELSKYIPYFTAKKYMVVPFSREGNVLHVAMEDPLNTHVIEDLKIISNMNINPFVCNRAKIQKTITLLYRDLNVQSAISDYKKELNSLSREYSIWDEPVSNYNILSSPIVRFFNTMLVYAIAEDASDIHIEPFKSECRIRFRIDGQLYTIMAISQDVYSALVSRIKILGKLDIAESRRPQDGRFMTTINQEDIDIRISTIPTIYGEKVVLRLLNKSRYFLTKENLGLSKGQMQNLDILLNNPNGIILVTGPAGSGKTTTLYAMLQALNRENKNIITIEDPVEYTIHGINQIQVDGKIDFANGLRAALRQDPDIIMVGEIRDVETAKIAIRSAITGHLVLSTLHTKDAVGAIIRLIDMGMEQFLLASSVVGVVSQRLVRVLCPKCKIKSDLLSQYMQFLKTIDFSSKIVDAYFPVGCSFCNFKGYKGRIGVFEILVITDDIKHALWEGVKEEELFHLAIQLGMQTIQDQCLTLLSQGVTDIQEVLRVIYSNELMYVKGGEDRI